MSSLHRRAMMTGVGGGLPPRPLPPGGGGGRGGIRGKGGRQRDYRPLEWNLYFDEKLVVEPSGFQGNRKFNVYESSSRWGH